MATRVKLRRGTATEHASFTGAEGEITVNTTNYSVRVHDGQTQGGKELLFTDLANIANNANLDGGTYGSGS